MWTRQLADDRFEVACLPFFTYGICHRDVVTIDSNHLVSAVVQKSGHRTLRVALIAEHHDRDQLHELLHDRITEAGLSHEWLQGTYLAVDPAPGSDQAIPSRRWNPHPSWRPSLGDRLLSRDSFR
ncbi:DUF4265 domain-containing protein [Streptomyces violascens]|uniref:DUF4265 domain-containing protein n=1 Tax=Streptomyces violascens TaxID=67381 RepID=UPI0036A26647